MLVVVIFLQRYDATPYDIIVLLQRVQQAAQLLPDGVWALAKETGRFDQLLRYPGEDGEYEAPKMDKLGL